MSKDLTVVFQGTPVVLTMEKVDRTRLYGYVETEVLDDQAKRCELVTLAGDGKTAFGKGGSAIAYLSPTGLWREKSQLRPVDAAGGPFVPVKSTFDAPVDLTHEAAIEELLWHNIHLVYQLSAQQEHPPLWDALRAGKMFSFPFSYRGGLEADTAFMLVGSDGNLFLMVGKPTAVEFVGLKHSAAVVVEDEGDAEEADDLLDFSIV